MKKLPVKSFTAELATSWRGALSCSRLWLSPSPYFKDSVLAASPLNEVTYATLFTYMYRRFGIPPLGGDDYKDLCGGWMLTTPSPSLLVKVSPSLNGADFSFIPFYLQPARQGKLVRDIDDMQLSKETITELKTAYQTLLLDLLRPACVRDSFLNAVGEVEDDSSLMRSNKDGELIYQVRYHKSAGFGVPSDLVGCDAYPTLCGMLMKAGEGDIAKGAQSVVTLLREPALKEAAAAPRSVKRLILMGAGANESQIVDSLGLSLKDQKQLSEDISLLHKIHWVDDEDESRASKIDAVLEETTDGDVATACALLTRLSCKSKPVSELFDSVLTNRAASVAWRDLNACGAGARHLVMISEEEAGTTDIQDLLFSRFLTHKQHDLVAWLDRTLARRRGEIALNWIVGHLNFVKPF